MKDLISTILVLILVFGVGSIYAQVTEAIVLEESNPKDSTRSNYTVSFKYGSPRNKDMEMVLNDYGAKFYRFKTPYIEPWFDFKKKLEEKSRIQLGVNYSSILIGASHTITEQRQKNAASGAFDAILKWSFINHTKGKNIGMIIASTDWRHKYYGEVTPEALNLESGSALAPAMDFTEWDFRVFELYYQQTLFSQRAAIVFGKIDLAGWFASNSLGHPFLHFTDMAFTANPAINWVNSGLGIAAGGWLDKKKRIGILAGFSDVAGDDFGRPRFLDFGAHMWAKGKFLKMVELVYSPESGTYMFDRLSLTYWDSDEVLTTDNSFTVTPSSRGVSMQGSWIIHKKYAPSISIAFSDGKGSALLSQFNMSVMNGFRFVNHDLLGVGLNYTRSTISETEQFLTEVFYRLTITQTLALTPMLKMVINPVLNPNTDMLFYYGLRGRVSL